MQRLIQWVGCAALVVGVGISLVVAWDSSQDRAVIAATEKYIETLSHPTSLSQVVEVRPFQGEWWALLQHPHRHRPEWHCIVVARIGDTTYVTNMFMKRDDPYSLP